MGAEADGRSGCGAVLGRRGRPSPWLGTLPMPVCMRGILCAVEAGREGKRQALGGNVVGGFSYAVPTARDESPDALDSVLPERLICE